MSIVTDEMVESARNAYWCEPSDTTMRAWRRSLEAVAPAIRKAALEEAKDRVERAWGEPYADCIHQLIAEEKT